MNYSRRFLPPLPWLTAFEAVARLGSVTAAAAELDLTQGAVSRQIQKLEDLLGLPLFLRERKRLKLTPAGAVYAPQIRQAVGRISAATLALSSNPHGGVLNLAILPAFGAHWLAPRLPDFLGEHPGITVNLATRTAPFDFSLQTFHAAIHFGLAPWPGSEGEMLLEEETVPAASPALLERTAGAASQGLSRLPRLFLETRSDAWERWFILQGYEFQKQSGMQFDQFATMIEAAKSGLGIALLPRYLIGAELKAGTLEPLPEKQPATFGAYFLAWPTGRDPYPPLDAFRAWLLKTAKRESRPV